MKIILPVNDIIRFGLFAAVSRASSRTCNNVLIAGRDDFSISSIRMIPSGADHPAWAKSLPNAGASSGSGYLDMSNRCNLRFNCSATTLTNSVLPTPVEPVRRIDALGLVGSLNPAKIISKRPIILLTAND